MTNIDPFKLVLIKTEECASCPRTLSIETEPFDANLTMCAAEIHDEHDAALKRAGWINGYCPTCVARGFGND